MVQKEMLIIPGLLMLAAGGLALASIMGMLPFSLPIPEEIMGYPNTLVGGGLAGLGMLLMILGFKFGM